MSDLSSVDQIHYFTENNAIKEGADTAIGNGLKKATTLFEQSGRNAMEADRAIVLFTDGVDDLPKKKQRKKNASNLEAAISWAAENNCPIYSVGFNYKLDDGKDSIDDNGIEKLERIAFETGGVEKTVTTLSEIEDQFSDILASICQLRYNVIRDIPGDGGRYEIPIQVTSGVVEMNIRIASETNDAVANGSITMLDPGMKPVNIMNSAYVRYDVERRAVSVKMIDPEKGKWTLILEGITGQDVSIGLLNHYSLELRTTMEVTSSDSKREANEVFDGDTVRIVSQLFDKNQPASDDYYDDITSAIMAVEEEGEKEKVIPMTLRGNRLMGEFVADGKDCVVIVEIATDYYDKKDMLALKGAHHPIMLTGNGIDDVFMSVGTSRSFDKIDSFAYDEDGDKITITAKSSDEKVVQEKQLLLYTIQTMTGMKKRSISLCRSGIRMQK